MTTETRIKFSRDNIGGVDWAFLPNSIFALARFQHTGRMFLVPNATTPTIFAAAKFIPIDNAKYDYAESYADFQRKASAFQDESTS